MIESLEIRITNKCNSRCIICFIWKYGIVNDRDMTLPEIKKLFDRKEFKAVKNLYISGGEPLLRPDISQVIDVLLKCFPKLERFDLTSNGTFPEKTQHILKKIAKKKNLKRIFLSLSLDGDRKIHKKIRRINSYDTLIKTIKLCKDISPKIKIIILTVINSLNCNDKILNHIKKIAEKNNTLYSFRPMFYEATSDFEKLSMSKEQKKLLIKFISKNKSSNPFFKNQINFLKKKKINVMKKCRSGQDFVIVKPNGDIYPCAFSTRKIGDKGRGIFIKNIRDRGKFEKCPCFVEYYFYKTFYKNKK